MAALQKELGTAFGRSFASVDADGILAKFYTWVTKSPVSGGPGWYIISDHSADGTDPYIVVCDIAAPGENDYDTGRTGGAPKICKVGLVDIDSGEIYLEAYLGFKAGEPQSLCGRLAAKTVDAGSFSYYFKGGDEFLSITSFDSSTFWNIAMIDDWVADLTLCEASTVVAPLTVGFSGVTTTEATIQLGTSKAVLFTVDNYYFITDSNSADQCDLVLCTNVDSGNDQITIVRQTQNGAVWSDASYGIGAVIGSYPHRFCLIGSGTSGQDVQLSLFPYIAVISNRPNAHKYNVSSNEDTPQCRFGVNEYLLFKKLVAEQPLLSYERSDNSSVTVFGFRAYGVPLNVYVANSTDLTRMANGLRINSNEYLYHANVEAGGAKALLILDESSLT